MPILTLFVPRAGAEQKLAIDPRSAIVGVLEAGADRVLAYFEGNRYGAENLKRYDERVEQAAGRLVQRYPTIAKASLALVDLVVVGTLDYEARRLEIVDEQALAQWAGEAVGSGLTKRAADRAEHERAKAIMRRGGRI